MRDRVKQSLSDGDDGNGGVAKLSVECQFSWLSSAMIAACVLGSIALVIYLIFADQPKRGFAEALTAFGTATLLFAGLDAFRKVVGQLRPLFKDGITVVNVDESDDWWKGEGDDEEDDD